MRTIDPKQELEHQDTNAKNRYENILWQHVNDKTVACEWGAEAATTSGPAARATWFDVGSWLDANELLDCTYEERGSRRIESACTFEEGEGG